MVGGPGEDSEPWWGVGGGTDESQTPEGLLSLECSSAAGHSGFRVGWQGRVTPETQTTTGLFQDPDVQLSKALSYALRHGALKLGLPMGAGK